MHGVIGFQAEVEGSIWIHSPAIPGVCSGCVILDREAGKGGYHQRNYSCPSYIALVFFLCRKDLQFSSLSDKKEGCAFTDLFS